MCGILCCINKNEVKPIPPIQSLQKSDFGLYWETDNSDIINRLFIKRDFENVRLTDSDKQKLANIEEIRIINEKLVKLKNNVKCDPKIEELRINFQNRLDELSNVQDEDVNQIELPLFESLMYKIASRGPDYINYSCLELAGLNCQLFSSILSLRQPFTKQPNITDEIIIQFNGELYNNECLDSNDTEFIVSLLDSNVRSGEKRTDAILKTICQLDGEFAFVLIDLLEEQVYFGRDSIGKRSLVYSLDDGLIVSSLPPSYQQTSYKFLECKNEISIFSLLNNEVQHKSYGDLWEKYKLRNLMKFNPVNMIPNVSDEDIQVKVKELYRALNRACLIRQETIHPVHLSDSLLGILFSGGLDCTIITSLICRNMRQKGGAIDLITVGFDNPRTNQVAANSPDRKLSKKSWFHLSKLYNSNTFRIRLVEVNVPYEDWLANKERVKELMYPNLTEMDLSIAIAFYFASKYEGRLSVLKSTDVEFETFQQNEKHFIEAIDNYKSDTRVLFSGLGADELFAGYSRHESLFGGINKDTPVQEISKIYDELSESLIHDINVIHSRNLGRDDRVISSWGKELRYPFLDNLFIQYVINEIEPNLKLSFTFELATSKKNKGNYLMRPIRKYILRELAVYLELYWVKDELKRAIQFGAKSAKLEIGQNKVKGTDIL